MPNFTKGPLAIILGCLGYGIAIAQIALNNPQPGPGLLKLVGFIMFLAGVTFGVIIAVSISKGEG